MACYGKTKQHRQIRCSGVFRCSGVPDFSTCLNELRYTVIIRINAPAAFVKFLALKMRRLFEGGVHSKEKFIGGLHRTYKS